MAVLAVVIWLGGGGGVGALAATEEEDAAPTVELVTAGRDRCAPAQHLGGDWTSLNGGFDNSRNQRSERDLGVDRARGLAPAWSFRIGPSGATGGLRSTPIVSGGCVYVASGEGYLGARGDVFALNADTGQLVWHVRTNGSLLGLAAANGMVYATPSKGSRGDVATPTVSDDYAPAGSYTIALDARTGRTRWVSERLDDGMAINGTFINASPVAFTAGRRPMVFVPLSGGGGDGARVPMYFLDARTGRTIRKAYSLSESEYREGYGGTGIWTTAAYDPATQHLYAGTADSDGKTKQHRYNNAILKIDANPLRRTFATVVASYAGTSERYDVDKVVPGFGESPLCTASSRGLPVSPPTFFDTSASPECLELDLDFGASPQLHTGAAGRRTVTALQKSGMYHHVDTTTMQRNWAAFLSPGGAAMNSATGAVGDDALYVGATPNLVYGLDRESGTARWASTTGVDAFAYQPLTLANEVLYGITDLGRLMAFEARTGMPILDRSVAADAGLGPVDCSGAGAGVAIARSMVFVPCDAGGLDDFLGVPSPPGALVAYR